MDVTQKLLWARLQEIRGSYNDTERLRDLLDKWEEDFGTKYQKIVDELIANAACQYWRSISAREGTTIDDLMRTQWEPWTEGEFTIEKTEDGVQIHCTKCPMADSYRAIGRVDYGVQFHCNEDEHIVAGYNPRIVFTRTKTLMEGDDCCDHRYSLR